MPEATMLPRTPLAVTETHHYSHGLYSVWPHVYFQDPQGRIRSVNGNEGGMSSVCVDAANLNTEFAAINWGGPESTPPHEERLYYTNWSGQIFEHCWSSKTGWYPGELNGQFKAAKYSTLAAATYSFSSTSLHHIQLYYQDNETDEICEIWKNGNNPWVTGARHPAGIKGTSIAAASTGKGTQIWYQQPDTHFVQYFFEAGKEWKKGNFVSTLEYNPGASISVAGSDRVFTNSRNNKLAFTPYNEKTGQWEPSKELIDQIPSGSVAAIAHPKHYSNTFIATSYNQKRPGEITRVKFNWDNTWEESTLPVTG